MGGELASQFRLRADAPRCLSDLSANAGTSALGWRGVGAPRNTPTEIIDKLNGEINTGPADPRMKARIADFGYTVFASSPADFGTFIAAYTEKWAKVIKFAGAKIY